MGRMIIADRFFLGRVIMENRMIMHRSVWSHMQPQAGMGVPRGVRTRHACMILIAQGEGAQKMFVDTPQGVF